MNIACDILELHLTYRCNLACTYCNRGCGLRQDHTPDITFAQAEAALTLPGIAWKTISILGGEPTLHPQCRAICLRARELFGLAQILLVSNAYTPATRALQEELSPHGIEAVLGTGKPHGSILHIARDQFYSPADLGIRRTRTCSWAAGKGCGFSADARGFTACAVGGAVDGILGLGVRTWDFAAACDTARLLRLCAHCGHEFIYAGDVPAEKIYTVRNHTVTRAWRNALQPELETKTL